MSSHENFKIIQMIAKGGTAVLYKAIQTSLDRTVAVKKLHQHLTDDENFTRRFILEAKAAASLDHQNIVHVIDFGAAGGEYQIIMEFVEGRSLKDILREKRKLPCDLALATTHQICLGLEHAHSKGIIHRDIKPGNIMVTKYGRVKLTDFGLAKLTQGVTQQTVTDSILGTPLYMSPEQAYGESVDIRSDIFSLGTVLYEMLTGEQPFLSDSCMGIINNIISCKIESPSSFNPEIPPEVEDIIFTALAKQRVARFQSAVEFRRAIEQHLGAVRLKEAEEKLPAIVNNNSKTIDLSSIPSPSSKLTRKRLKAWTAISATLIAAVAAGVTFHFDMLSSILHHLLSGPQMHKSVSILPKESSLMGYNYFLPYDSGAGETLTEQSSSVAGNDSLQAAAGDSTQVPSMLPASAVLAALDRDSINSITADSADDENKQPVHSDAKKSPERSAKETEEEIGERTRPRNGWLSISVEPWAEIYLDGRYWGDAPTPSPISLPGGIHTLECKNPQYETYREDLNITPSELSRRTIKLKKLKGMIQVFTQAGVEFYLDGLLVGITPLSEPAIVDVGKHQLTLKKNGFNTWTSEINIEANQTIPLKITLSPRF